LVAQLQIHEGLVVTLALLQRVQVVRPVLVLVQLVRVLLLQLVLVQLVVQRVQVVKRVQQLFVAPLELVEHPCLQKKLMLQKKLQENLAYLF
jgi:hypothetical protein